MFVDSDDVSFEHYDGALVVALSESALHSRECFFGYVERDSYLLLPIISSIMNDACLYQNILKRFYSALG